MCIRDRLVVVLGVVEGASRLGGLHLGGDVTKTVVLQHDLERVTRRSCRCLLMWGGPVDRAAVLRAEVVSLAEALRRVVVLPELLEQELGGGERRVIGDQHRLGMARATAAYLLVGRVGGVAPHVSDRRGDHAGELPEDALGTPEATHCDVQDLDPGWPRPMYRGAEALVTVGDARQRCTPSGQGVVGGCLLYT